MVNRALSFLLLPLYLDQIRERDYGALNLMMIVLLVLNVVLPLGMSNALFRSYYDFSEKDRPILTTTALLFLFFICTLVLIPLYLLSPSITRLVLHESKFESHFKIIFIIAFFQIIKIIPDAVLRLKMQSIRYTVAESLAFGTQLSFIIYFVAIKHIGIYGILLGTLFGAIFETGSLFILVFVSGGLGWGFNKSELRRMLNFGSPLIFGRLSAICLQSIDRFFIQYYAITPKYGQRDVGVYAMANNVSGAVTFLVTTPFGAVWPAMQISVMNDKDARQYYARILTYVMYCTIFLALGAACVTKDVFFFFGRYTDAISVIPLLLIAAVLDAASQVLSVGINLKRKTYINPLIYLTSALVNIGLNFFLIPRFGIVGAALATAEGFFVLCVLRYFISNYYVPIDYEWNRLGRLISVAIFIYGIGSLISTGRTIFDFILHSIITFTFPLLLLAVNFYDEKEKKKLIEYWNRLNAWMKIPQFSKQI